MPRYELLREAIDVARGLPAQVDREGIDTWIARELAELPSGEATVVFHSLVWIYLEQKVRSAVLATLDRAAAAASEDRPLSWLRYELAPDLMRCELRITTWPGGDERLLATGDVHLAPVTWLG